MVKVSPTTKKTTFKIELPDAEEVMLVGEFNGWDGNATPMKKMKGGAWKTDVKLDAGEYQFRYLVDHRYWINDEDLPTVPNNFGGENSIAMIELPAKKAAPRKRPVKKASGNGK